MKITQGTVGAIIALTGVGMILHELIKQDDNWKEATTDDRSSQEASEPARISGNSDRDNGSGPSDLRIFNA